MTHLVTGGLGFLGSRLARELLGAGHAVRVLDNGSRANPRRLGDAASDIEIVEGDVRDADVVRTATKGCSTVWHLAYINGTRFFYERPDEVLDVGIRGTLTTIEAALAAGVTRYVFASTSETYNDPSAIPTDESERLMVPDVTNPRFSYGGGKIAGELLTLHLGGRRGLETVIFRPHNVYGPDMGHEHVIPELIERIVERSDGLSRRQISLPIEGDGTHTRAFCYIDDGARGARIAGELGESGEVYHLGTTEEITIGELVHLIGGIVGVSIRLEPRPLRRGSTPRRCPDITKLGALGYRPVVGLEEGLKETVPWYVEYALASGPARA
jgi:nucleoside-diphosphate-sugar epimerase